MAAFARQNRPRMPNARPVDRAAIGTLAMAVVIVTAPARALRQVMLERAIDYLDRIAHNGIVRIADAETHQVQEIAADNIPRRMQAATIRELDHRRIRIGM